MNFVEHLQQKLTQALEAERVEIIDNSWMHAGHMGATPGQDGTHLQVTVVSERFRTVSPLDRHRMVHQVLQEEMATRIHAMELKTLLPEPTTAS